MPKQSHDPESNRLKIVEDYFGKRCQEISPGLGRCTLQADHRKGAHHYDPERCPMCGGIDRGYRKQIAYNGGEYMAPCRHEWHPANKPPSDDSVAEALILDRRRTENDDAIVEEESWVALSERSLATWCEENPYEEDDPLAICAQLAEIATAIECGNPLPTGSAGIVSQASTRIAEHDNQLGQALENYGMHWARKAAATQQRALARIEELEERLAIAQLPSVTGVDND